MAEETGKEEREDEPVEGENTTSEPPTEKSDSEYGGARSEVDAMGNDKRREVIGQQYGATVRKRVLIYGGVVGITIVVVIAFLTVVKGYDQRNVPLKNTAPWTEAGASQAPPRDVDFKANGPTDTIPADQIYNR